MKNLVILIILGALGYFGYTAFNNSTTLVPAAINAGQAGLEDLQQDIPQGQKGALIDLNNKIKNTLDDARNVVDKVSVTANDFIEEGITDLADTDIEIPTENQAVANPGLYEKYENVNIASLEGNIVLDFYASWCPSCRKLESDINDSLNDIPSNMNIIQVDYDNETALKNKYGVTRQHTLVQVDNQGNMIKKWSGGSTLESVIAEIQ